MEPSLEVEPSAIPPRRRYSRDFKRQVVQESFAAGASIARVAQSHGINANLLHTWRWQFRRELGCDDTKDHALVPIELGVTATAQAPSLADGTGYMEVVIGGARVMVRGSVSEATLRGVFNALRT